MPALIGFSFQNDSVLQLAEHLKRHTTGSSDTLYQYIYGVHRFSKWIKKDPDTIIRESRKAPNKYVRTIDDFIGDLQALNLAPGTITKQLMLRELKPFSE